MTADIIHPFVLFTIFLLFKYQFEVQAKHTTLQAVSTINNKFSKCLDPECHYGKWDFTQLKRTFNTVNHNISIKDYAHMAQCA